TEREAAEENLPELGARFLERPRHGRLPVAPGGAREVLDARAVPRQADADHGHAEGGEVAAERSQLRGRAGPAVDQDAGGVGGGAETEGLGAGSDSGWMGQRDLVHAPGGG